MRTEKCQYGGFCSGSGLRPLSTLKFSLLAFRRFTVSDIAQSANAITNFVLVFQNYLRHFIYILIVLYDLSKVLAFIIDSLVKDTFNILLDEFSSLCTSV